MTTSRSGSEGTTRDGCSTDTVRVDGVSAAAEVEIQLLPFAGCMPREQGTGHKRVCKGQAIHYSSSTTTAYFSRVYHPGRVATTAVFPLYQDELLLSRYPITV